MKKNYGKRKKCGKEKNVLPIHQEKLCGYQKAFLVRTFITSDLTHGGKVDETRSVGRAAH